MRGKICRIVVSCGSMAMLVVASRTMMSSWPSSQAWRAVDFDAELGGDPAEDDGPYPTAPELGIEVGAENAPQVDLVILRSPGSARPNARSAKPLAGGLIRISITAADFDVIAATMPPGFAGFICSTKEGGFGQSGIMNPFPRHRLDYLVSMHD